MCDTLFHLAPGTRDFSSPYEDNPKAERLAPAQPFTVSLVSAMVCKDFDSFLRGKNDLMIITQSTIGERPKVDRVHYYQENIPKHQVLKNFFSDTVYLNEDFNGFDRLWLEMKIVEVDSDHGAREDTIATFERLVGLAGSVYPTILPYVLASSSVMKLANKLLQALERDRYVVNVPIALYPTGNRPGKAILQTGTYAAFSQPVNAEELIFKQNGQISRKNRQPMEVSYVCFHIEKGLRGTIRDVVHQKMAILLTQMSRQKNENTPRATLDFLTETLSVYTNFRRLERYQQLLTKETLTQDEKRLMGEIEQTPSLQPFLPE
jgi:hypothetical protein